VIRIPVDRRRQSPAVPAAQFPIFTLLTEYQEGVAPQGFMQYIVPAIGAPAENDHFLQRRPIAFDRNEGKALFANQPLTDTASPIVIFGRAVRGFS
jgi:hypothetical protein